MIDAIKGGSTRHEKVFFRARRHLGGNRQRGGQGWDPGLNGSDRHHQGGASADAHRTAEGAIQAV